MGGPDSVSDGVGGVGYGIGDRDLRVSDAEREHVGELLQRAVGLGMLSLGEFTERMDTALAAKTRGELNSVLIDLPGVRLVGEPVTPRPPYHHPHVPHSRTQPGAAAAAAMGAVVPGAVLRGRVSSIARRGPWQVPPVLRVNSVASTVTLDFTAAMMTTQVVEIQVDDYASTLTLIVPTEATVDLNGVDLVGGSANNKVHTGPPIGPLHLVVHGRVRFGSVIAKHPFMAQWRKLLGP
ncbi:hypothetical protein B0T44_16230 [Nocardia donostiensis]|uniref:DUF1707 domain-containing protein n=1 Tax=Nocardia donostiensis TaxID=1538463 RepID=A0A1W0AQQ0_9NOCA|nr:hypothetical protein B0T46_21945 [Nocardia donostiensis]OQS12524.1 hypothetical protein B0T36_24600 [Nocardia donostiensis]OQS19027.1 hypothetical protein B0T44_16230 [Nocardia donostiensis]